MTLCSAQILWVEIERKVQGIVNARLGTTKLAAAAAAAVAAVAGHRRHALK